MSVSLGRRHETDTTPLSIIGELRLSIWLISKSYSRLLSSLLLESEDKRRYSLFRGLSTPILFACSICCNWSYLSGDFVWSIISCLFLFHPTCPWHAVTWVLLCAEAILQASMVASYLLHLLLMPFYLPYPDLSIFYSIHSCHTLWLPIISLLLAQETSSSTNPNVRETLDSMAYLHQWMDSQDLYFREI